MEAFKASHFGGVSFPLKGPFWHPSSGEVDPAACFLVQLLRVFTEGSWRQNKRSRSEFFGVLFLWGNQRIYVKQALQSRANKEVKPRWILEMSNQVCAQLKKKKNQNNRYSVLILEQKSQGWITLVAFVIHQICSKCGKAFNILGVGLFCFFLVVLFCAGDQPKASHMQGKCSATGLHPSPPQ